MEGAGVGAVTGVLVGAASLNYHQFSEIASVAHQVQTERKDRGDS
jgi:triosephosphate isomerase